MKFLIRKSLFLSFIAGVLMLISCGSNDIPTPTPEPKPGSEEALVFKLKSSNIVEFQKIVGETKTSIVQEEAEDFFGNRIEFVIPNEIQINGDSLSIKKSHGIVENYSVKWQKDELFLSRDSNDNWEYCGKLSGNNRFLLNIVIFTLLSKNEQRTLYVSGQDYSLTSTDKIMRDPEDIVVWLKLEVVLEK